MKKAKGFERFLEIVPGALAWATIIAPFILAPTAPIVVAYFILIFSLYWFFKGLNFSRHLVFGYRKMARYMKIDWYARCEHLKDLNSSISFLEKDNGEDDETLKDLKELYKVNGSEDAIKNLDDIYHTVFIAVYKETYDVVEPSVRAILKSNYPNNRISVILACEEREPESVEVGKRLKEKFGNEFHHFDYVVHPEGIPHEVKGKGSNISYAGKKYKKYFDQHDKELLYENVLVTNLDGDHIVHKQYFARLTYKYIIDPNREKKTYQPVALLFNNIWDAPAINRVAAVSSSFWQLIESVRPYRQRTFAAHTQSLKTLVRTNFWATDTIVEDGHQYWRTYFAYGGHIEMVPLMVPVYQDAVLLDTYWKTLKGQYLQMRRWAWGTTDFPFVVLSFMKHKEIPFGEKFVQTARQFVGNYSWATASLLIGGAWIPLIFNKHFQETVIAHNVTSYSSLVMGLTWFGILVSIWVYFALIPKRPKRYGFFKNFLMLGQWIIAPLTAIFMTAFPALEAQTRQMIGKKLEFWTTPKYRKDEEIVLKD